jgi:hypothetical protein
MNQHPRARVAIGNDRNSARPRFNSHSSNAVRPFAPARPDEPARVWRPTRATATGSAAKTVASRLGNHATCTTAGFGTSAHQASKRSTGASPAGIGPRQAPPATPEAASAASQVARPSWSAIRAAWAARYAGPPAQGTSAWTVVRACADLLP